MSDYRPELIKHYLQRLTDEQTDSVLELAKQFYKMSPDNTVPLHRANAIESISMDIIKLSEVLVCVACWFEKGEIWTDQNRLSDVRYGMQDLQELIAAKAGAMSALGYEMVKGDACNHQPL